MGFEPTTASLEGWNSTTELRPPTVTRPTLQRSDGDTLGHTMLSTARSRSLSLSNRTHTFHVRFGRIRSVWWAGKDSNLGSHKAADLQSAPFVHLGTCPLGTRSQTQANIIYFQINPEPEPLHSLKRRMKVSPTMHSSPAKQQGWSADEMRIDLASKAADFICDAFHCQGGMFYAGTNLRCGRSLTGSTGGRNNLPARQYLISLASHVRWTTQNFLHE